MALLMTIVSAVYVGRTVDHQWVPHDEGALAQSADRTAHGELPHRDFIELYTGGLTDVNALAFRVFGERLNVLRVVLMLAFVLWIPAVYYVASRLAGPVAAALATAASVAWSVPNYPAPLPSWYNLFFAVFAIAALFRFIETSHRRWLVACGAAVGLSICTKIVGLYLAAGVVLVLVWHEQTASESRDSNSGRWFGLVVTGGLVAMVLALVALVRHVPRPAVFVHFVVPTAVLVAVLMLREWRRPHVPSSLRVRRAVGLALPLAIGCAVPIIVFITPYVASGAVHDLVRGVFVTPARRVQLASWPLPVLRSGWPALLLAAALGGGVALPRRWQWLAAASIGIPTAYELVTWVRHPALYATFWSVARLAIPLVVACGAIVLIVQELRGRLDASTAERIFTLLSVAALCSLVQFPFSAAIYFCYVAPLAVLAILGVARPSPVAAVVAMFFTLFAVLTMHGRYLGALGHVDPSQTVVAPLHAARAGLSVPLPDVATYDRLIPLVQQHAGPSRYAYAAPDCPEVTFLAGLRNPTGTLFDIFDDSSGHTDAVLRALRQHDVRVVALNADPEFSAPIRSDLDSTLEAWYPEADTVGRFTVRWRP
ncbi:MAG TPA: glycosyltransferase family 39 protein [Gemmatimonadaceae bacterium]|nr:glycosyltransferase family 39 protein [Gemmatimonadaceae bacterium]